MTSRTREAPQAGQETVSFVLGLIGTRSLWRQSGSVVQAMCWPHLQRKTTQENLRRDSAISSAFRANVGNQRRDWLLPTVKDKRALETPDNAQDRLTVSSAAFPLLSNSVRPSTAFRGSGT